MASGSCGKCAGGHSARQRGRLQRLGGKIHNHEEQVTNIINIQIQA